jgi:hypothetical protein
VRGDEGERGGLDVPTRPSESAHTYLTTASARFRQIYAALERSVLEIFPDAEASFQSRMPGWRIPRPRHVDPASAQGTLDPNWVQIYLVERKSGITLHLWNPVDFNGFRRRDKELERAGFKLMVGSVRFNRKSEYPIGLVVDLLKDAKASLVDDERRGGKPPSEKGRPPASKSKAAPRPAMDPKLRAEIDEWSAEPPMDGGD